MIRGLVLQSRGRLVILVELERSTFLVRDHRLQRLVVPAREGLVSFRVQDRLVRKFCCERKISLQVVFTGDWDVTTYLQPRAPLRHPSYHLA